jgi:hypothetical protein
VGPGFCRQLVDMQRHSRHVIGHAEPCHTAKAITDLFSKQELHQGCLRRGIAVRGRNHFPLLSFSSPADFGF